MGHWMILLRRGADGREYWRGNGFDLTPGAVTYVGYETTGQARKYVHMPAEEWEAYCGDDLPDDPDNWQDYSEE